MILITRPAPDGETLCRQLKARGYQTIWLPTLAFVSLHPPAIIRHESTPESCSTPGQRVAHLNSISGERKTIDYHWLIFISREAARHALPCLPPTLPSPCRIAAVGQRSAHLLTAQGYTVSACPDHANGADALLSLPAFQSPVGQRIAIIKGEGGRKEPARTLSTRGALVTEISVYRRICPAPDNLAACCTLIQQHQISALLITSGKGLLNLLRMTGKTCRIALQQTPLIVISPRLQRLATRLGFSSIQLAANPGEDAMINALTFCRKIP